MKIKHILFLSGTLAIFFTTPRIASALDITITQDGTVEIYSDSVLGVDSSSTEQQRSVPSKIIPPSRRQELRVVPTKDSLKVETVERNRNTKTVLETENADRLRLSLPAHQTEEQRRLEMAKQRAGSTDTSLIELERQVTEQTEQREKALNQLSPEERMRRELFYEKQKDERENRVQERIELKNTQGVDGQELQLQSRGINAALKHKAVTIDPETNSLVLTTKDGEQRVLTTLPDQAVERMLEVRGVDSIDPDAIELTERDGRLQYVTRARKMKKLFGIFNREIETELSVDDQSGQVSEQLDEKPTIIGRFLDRLSF